MAKVNTRAGHLLTYILIKRFLFLLFACICKHSHTHAYGGAAHLEVGYLTVRVSWPSALTTMLPSRCEDAAEAVFSTHHSCLTNPCPTHCSPTHTNLCPLWMHRLRLESIHSDKPFINLLLVNLLLLSIYYDYNSWFQF